jgi:dTDP-D-glucose 4,6-dehydratase
VDVTKAEQRLGWHATKSNVDTLVENYDWYAANRARMKRAGVTHRVPWNQQALGWLKKVS